MGTSPPAPAPCLVAQQTAFRQDAIARETGECYRTWYRPGARCVTRSLYTVELLDPASTVVVYAGDDAGVPDVPGQPTTPAACQARTITMKVERESTTVPGLWVTLGTFTQQGTWNYDASCTVWTGYKFLAIPRGTTRVRVSAQSTRQDGSHGGTLLLVGYEIPGPPDACED